nr:hypothetical protein BaRGS_002294 [Batillaria attramentaria]
MTDGQFYSQTAICLPLPITLRKFPGQQYAFGVFIVFNLVLFLAISCGQLLIYQAVNDTREAADIHRHQQDVAIARRLFLIVFSDFCCWFPIGVMGILAERGTPLPSVVNVWAAIFMLPLNSAINPFLYTLNTMLERRRKRKEEARVKAMLAKLHAELVTWPPDRLQELVHRGQRLLAQAKGREYVVSMTEAGFIQVVKDVQEVGKKILLTEASKEGESDTANCDSTTQADERETELEERLQTLDQLCQKLMNLVPTSNTISDKGFQRPDNTSHKDF